MTSQGSSQRVSRPRRFAVVAALALLAAGAVSSPPTPAYAASNAEVESSIVYIVTEWTGFIYIPGYVFTDGEGVWTDEVTTYSSCTGWFASAEGHIMTAGHCVDPSEGRTALLSSYLGEADRLDLLNDATVNWTVEGPNSGDSVEQTVQVIQPNDVEGAIITNNPITAQVVAYRGFEEGDLALLHVGGIEATPPLVVADTSPENGDELTAVGFPATVSGVVDGTRVRASFKSGTASSQQYRADSGIPTTEINADISPGMSGGPTVNANGEVLGVNSFILTNEKRNFNFITDTNDLETFLVSNGIEYLPASAEVTPTPTETAAPPVPTEASAPVPPVANTPTPTESSLVVPTPEPSNDAALPVSTQDDFGPMVLLGVVVSGILLIALILFYVLVWRKRKLAENEPGGVHCPTCGTYYTNGARFCLKDGTLLPHDISVV